MDDARAFHTLLTRNRAYLDPWMPARDEDWYELPQVTERLRRDVDEHARHAAYHFKVVDHGDTVGRIDMTNVVRGAWQNTTLGYWVAESHRNRGCATAAVKACIDFAFAQAALHRVQAAIMPRNAASIRVIEKAGFRNEGLAERYLRINGRWEDHLIYAITAEE